MKFRKIILLCLIVASLASLAAITVSAAFPSQPDPSIPEFYYNIKEEPAGSAKFTFGSTDADVYYHVTKGNLGKSDSVFGSCHASGSDVKGTRIWIKATATNWLTGTKEYYGSEEAVFDSYRGYAHCTTEFECDLWHAVETTYHEGTIVHQNGSTSIIQVTGSLN